MNFHFAPFSVIIFFIYDTVMCVASTLHVSDKRLYCMYNKNFQNEKSDENNENEIICEKLSEKFDENENIIIGGLRQ